MSQSHLLFWLRKQGYVLPSKARKGEPADKREQTHLSLIGGKYCVPEDQEDTFLTFLCRDMASEIKHFMVERRTPVFRFFLDMDFLRTFDAVPFDDKMILDYVARVQEVVRKYYPSLSAAELEVIVSLNTPRSEKHQIKDGVEYKKVGVHLIWKNIFLTDKEALQIRAHLVEYFTQHVVRQHGFIPWEDVFDRSVLDGNGLRMIKNFKTKPCPNGDVKTHEAFNTQCDYGCQNAKLPEQNVYWPKWVVDGNGVPVPTDPLVANKNVDTTLELVMKATRIRCSLTEPSPPVLIPEGAPPFEPSGRMLQAEGKQRKTKRKLEMILDDNFKPALGEVSHRTTEDNKSVARLEKQYDYLPATPQSAIIHNEIQTFLNKCCDHWPNVMVNAVMVNATKNSYCVQVRGDGSGYCTNLGRCHSNNHVYFLINAKELRQRCHCSCATLDGRLSGVHCKKYQSEGYKLDVELRTVLFPDFQERGRKKTSSSFTNNRLSAKKLKPDLSQIQRDTVHLYGGENNFVDSMMRWTLPPPL
eukprot:GILJ01012428.1.p1 GENE.GILJ01012428.1~~GILJ01012428.1.p1  ORF type:complete len:527 (-),score=62.28 GILJ01012428.1:89-1669(-)